MMEVSPEVISFLQEYHVASIFLGSVFLGESVVLAASFFAAEGLWSPFTVFWAALLGTLCADSLWFLAGARAVRYFEKRKRWERAGARLARLERHFGERPFLMLLFVKFLYGTRVLTLLYLSYRRLSFSTFFVFNAAGTMLWLSVMIALGWLAGVGASTLIAYVGRAEIALLVLAVLLIVYQPLCVWVSKKILAK